jgi:hypothetical protein
LRTGGPDEVSGVWSLVSAPQSRLADVMSARAADNAEGFVYAPASVALKMKRTSTVYLTLTDGRLTGFRLSGK